MTDECRTFVKPAGSLSEASFMIVGEQPGKTEVLKNQPFVGAAGRVLDECLRLVGINRNECYITNVFKDLDFPLSQYIKFTPKRVILQCERAQEYLDILKEEVRRFQGKVIIALGNVALWALTERRGISKWRGSVLPCALDECKQVVPTFHPATVLPPKLQYLNKYLIQYDLKKALRVLRGEWKPMARNIRINPTYEEVIEFLQVCEEHGLKGHYIAFDIEVLSNLEVSCISFAYAPDEVMSIPFVHANRQNRWTPDQELEIWRLIARILENPNIKKLGQNLTFDAHFLLRKYGIHAVSLEDTMIAQQILMSEFPKGLDFITSVWTDENYYKDEGKIWFKHGGSWEQLWVYNALDSAICQEVFPKQLEALRKQGNMPTYERQRKLIEPLVFMQEHGIRVDVEGMEQRRKELEEEKAELLEKLYSLAGRELNPNSPKQLVQYFYVEKGLKPYLKSGRPSVDNIALKRLIRKGIEEAKLISRIRALNKIINNYLDPAKIDSDGRIRCSYNPAGTRFSRLSSSASIFGTGMNLQNIPHEVAQFFLPDEGYVAYSFDLSQAENRIVAYVGKIEQMIEAFESGKDVHSLTAALIFGDSYEQVKQEDANNIPCNLGDGTKTKRYYGKRCVTGDVEVLTPEGWVPIERWNWKTTPIMQWWPDGTLEFTMATNMTIDVADYTIELAGHNTSIRGSDNHRVPLYRKDTKTMKVLTLGSLEPQSSLGRHYGVPTCGIFKGNQRSILTSPEVKLLVAFQADGSFNYKSHRFKLKKRRKINRLKAILEELGIKYTESKLKDGMTSIYFKGPSWLTKNFGPFLLLLGEKEMRTFIKEIPFWDGYKQKGSNQYFTTNYNNAVWVQTIAALTGHTAVMTVRKPTGFGKKPLYIVCFNSRTRYATLVSQRKVIKPAAKVYGPEVPSGFILVRHKGRISVTGNSNHSLNYGISYKTFALYLEIPETQAKFLVEAYHRAYPGVRNGFHAYVKKCLAENRTLTNLMGRKTLFLDKWGDQLFKDAYACIPQGTVGDLINERGINFIYYNQSLFHPIVLLNQIHDSIEFELPLDIGWREHARLILEIKRSLERPLRTHYGREFVIPADLTIMPINFYKEKYGKELKSRQIPDNVDDFARLLSEAYNELCAKGTQKVCDEER